MTYLPDDPNEGLFTELEPHKIIDVKYLASKKGFSLIRDQRPNQESYYPLGRLGDGVQITLQGEDNKNINIVFEELTGKDKKEKISVQQNKISNFKYKERSFGNEEFEYQEQLINKLKPLIKEIMRKNNEN